MLTCCSRTVERALAFATIEACEMAACKWSPNDAVARDIESAGREALNRGFRIFPRQFVDFSERGLGRIRPWVDSDNPTWKTEDRSPNGTIRPIDSHAIERTGAAFILHWIDGLIGLDVRVALAVAVRIEDERRPTLRFLFVAGLIEHLHVQPTNDITTAAAGRPERVIRILCELQVV